MKWRLILTVFIIVCFTILIWKKDVLPFNQPETGTAIDSFNGVYVYYNGRISNVHGRNLSEDGYNIGLKYQCVEFVKRYYYQYYKHKMPNSYGHAKDFFNSDLKDGGLNVDRGLIQYSNPSHSKPQLGDLLVYSGTGGNPYGHVSIVSKVDANTIEVIQQNSGQTGPCRQTYKYLFINNLYKIDEARIVGRLRLQSSAN